MEGCFEKHCHFFFLSLVLPVSAIVVQDYTLAEAAPAGLDWNYVYNYKGSSAVSVGEGWLLTAAHVADDGGDGSLTIGTTVYQQQQIEYHPNADLALVRYDKAFPGSYGLYTGSEFKIKISRNCYCSPGPFYVYTSFRYDSAL